MEEAVAPQGPEDLPRLSWTDPSRYTGEAIMFRRLLRQLAREAREFAEMV